ncbi:unnamed protein product [Parnassius mnemosyne]|uniref:DDE Tnp4 domain-containing protein n=1 Tax=Parnassius mnemosyne TaxID=213953 RepID=A0AAV1LZH4_9NEOP
MESHVQRRRRIAVAAASYILLVYLRQKLRKRKRQYWVKTIFKNRLEYGTRLYKELIYEGAEANFARTTANQFDLLCSLLENKIRKNDTNYRDDITVKERLLLTLRFLASGDSYVSLQYLFRVSKQSISEIVPEVCEAIIDVLKDYVKMPSNEEEWLAVSQEFDEKWNFPHVLGAMDGKHVVLQAPFNSGNDYDNYKLFPSIVLFALVDANYRLSRARRFVENAFGVLSSSYRVLRKPMLLEPEKATKVVLATVYLYNYLRSNSNLRVPQAARHFITNGAIVWQNEYQ